MINTINLQEAKSLIKKEKIPIIVKAQTLEFNRKMLEYGKFDILLDIHTSQDNQKDKIKQLASGLNHILAKIATKNKIALGIDLKPLRKLDKKQKALQLARIKQNIKIARKAKTKIKLLNYKNEKDTRALLQSLGASSQQAKKAIS